MAYDIKVRRSDTICASNVSRLELFYENEMRNAKLLRKHLLEQVGRWHAWDDTVIDGIRARGSYKRIHQE